MTNSISDGTRSDETLSRLLLEHLQDAAVFALDREGQVQSWNAAAERLLGYAEAEVLGKQFAFIFTPEDRQQGLPAAELRSAREHGRAEDERWHLRKSGERFWALGIVSALHAPNGRLLGFAQILRDMTQRKRADEALRASQEKLRQLASELSQAERRERKRLAKILHDHLQQLIVAAQIQVKSLTRDKALERRQGTAARAQRVQSILEEALDASRSLAVELNPPILNKAGLIGALDWLTARMQAQHGLSIRLITDPAAEVAAEDTRFLLFDCVRELLLNVVKHAEDATAEVALLRRSDTEIALRVSDTGKGFEPSALEQRRRAEAGFGLFNIQERLAYLDGRMAIESAPGHGTRVTLVIAAAPAPEAPEAPEAAAEAAAEATGVDGATTTPGDDGTRGRALRRRRCRVLIIDDHPMMREGLASLLAFETDIEIVGQAGDVSEAIATAASLNPDVVLMDIELGAEMDGIEATRRILATQPLLKVIGLSMHTEAAVAKAMREAGAVAYIPKGGQPDDLIAAIRSCCTW